MHIRAAIYGIVVSVILVACGDVSSTSVPNTETDATPDVSNQIDDSTAATLTAQPTLTLLPTFAPTFTPQATDGLPALELLSGDADTCVNTDAFNNVLGFNANYDELTTENLVTYRLLDMEGNVITEGDTPGENKDGEEGWGFYPDAYEVDAGSALVVEVAVYETDAEDALLTSTSSLIYNCTTGETISTTFFRTPQEDD